MVETDTINLQYQGHIQSHKNTPILLKHATYITKSCCLNYYIIAGTKGVPAIRTSQNKKMLLNNER